MTDIPIIFSAPMVLALLAGRKTQTRRLAWRERKSEGGAINDGGGQMDYVEPSIVHSPSPWQRVQPGDRLWVRENWKPVPASAYRCSEGVQQTQNPNDADEAAVYSAGWDRSTGGQPWRPSIHMPRWASRLTLTVTEVRVQKLQAISRGDAMEEGCPFSNMAAGPSPRDWFRDLWDKLHGPFAWDVNTEVVALSFTVEQRNIDA